MDTRTDNKESQMEPAEGSRENVNPGPMDPASGGNAPAPMERGAGQVSQPEKPLPGQREDKGGPPKGYPKTDSDDAGGITNRPLSEEERNQRAVPGRGHAKDE